MAYVLQLDLLEREVRQMQTMAILAAANGGRDIEWPSLTDYRARFDAELHAAPPPPPTRAQRERAELLDAMGVRPQ